MYIPSAFAQTDTAQIAQLIDQHPLAALVGQVDGRIVAHHLPFMRAAGLAPGERIVAHAARGNPIWQLGESRAEVLLIFTGAAAYISPSYYPSKAEHHRVVPTYNYAYVHVRGALSCSHDAEEKLQVVELLTNRLEARRATPWSVADAPRDYIAKMLQGIVALRMPQQASRPPTLQVVLSEAELRYRRPVYRKGSPARTLGLRFASCIARLPPGAPHCSSSPRWWSGPSRIRSRPMWRRMTVPRYPHPRPRLPGTTATTAGPARIMARAIRSTTPPLDTPTAPAPALAATRPLLQCRVSS